METYCLFLVFNTMEKSKRYIRITEEELKKIVKVKIPSIINEILYPSNPIFERIKKESQLFLEAKHLFSNNDDEKWTEVLIDSLVHIIEKHNNNRKTEYKPFAVDSGEESLLPKVPYMERYRINISFDGSIDGKSLYVGNLRLKTPYKTSAFDFNLMLPISDDLLRLSIATFVYHEFMHAYQKAKMGYSNGFSNYVLNLYGIEYPEIANLTQLSPESQVYKSDELNILLTEVLKIIQGILYKCNAFEKGAFVSQAVANYKYNIKYTKGYNGLGKEQKLRELYDTKEYAKLVDDINDLRKILNKYPEEIRKIILKETQLHLKQFNRFKTCGAMLKYLVYLSKHTYTTFCQKVKTVIDEDIIRNRNIIIETSSMNYPEN